MKEVKRALIKQLQLIEIELGEYKMAQTFEHPPFHEEEYYAKIAWVHKLLLHSINLLEEANEKIKNDKRAEIFNQ
jgi:hypothetical protein